MIGSAFDSAADALPVAGQYVVGIAALGWLGRMLYGVIGQWKDLTEAARDREADAIQRTMEAEAEVAQLRADLAVALKKATDLEFRVIAAEAAAEASRAAAKASEQRTLELEQHVERLREQVRVLSGRDD